MKKGINILLAICCLLFLALYGMLSWFDRLPYEDYHFTAMTKEMGPINAMINIYEVYSARWSAHTLGFYFSQFYKIRYFLFLFHLVTLTALYIAIGTTLKKVLGKGISDTELWLYTGLLTITFFFSSYSIGETWFWYMVNWMYLWSIIAGSFLFRLLVVPAMSFLQITSTTILTAYIAGAAESYALIFILAGLLLFILKKKEGTPEILKTISNNKLTLTLALLTGFFLITIFAPGTWLRKERLVDATFAEHTVMVFKAYGKVILQTLPLIPYLLLFSIPWIFLGNKLKSKGPYIELFIVRISIGLAVSIFILILPASWVLYDVPPARGLSQVSLMLASCLAFIFLRIGQTGWAEKNAIRWSGLALIAGIMVIGFHIYDQYSIVTDFSKEYDSRFQTIANERHTVRKTTLLFQPLPSSGMLYGDELSTDSTWNKHFEKLCSPDFHVASEK